MEQLWTRPRRFAVPAAVALVGVAMTASAAVGSPHVAAKKTPRPPVTGHWDVNHTATTDVEAAGGHFTITAHHKFLKSFAVKLGPGAETACGTGTIKVVGKLRVYDAKGESEFGSYNEWVVGKSNPAADPVIYGEKVTLVRAGKRFKGTFDLVFARPRGGKSSGGEIGFPNKALGGCDLSFGVKKA